MSEGSLLRHGHGIVVAIETSLAFGSGSRSTRTNRRRARRRPRGELERDEEQRPALLRPRFGGDHHRAGGADRLARQAHLAANVPGVAVWGRDRDPECVSPARVLGGTPRLSRFAPFSTGGRFEATVRVVLAAVPRPRPSRQPAGKPGGRRTSASRSGSLLDSA